MNRRLIVRGAVVAAVIVGGTATVAYAMSGSPPKRHVSVTAPNDSTDVTPTTEASTTTTEAPTTTGTGAPTTTVVTSPPTTVTPTTALVCSNSTDPACGAFSWNPSPQPLQPMSLTVTPTVSGSTVAFHAVVHDSQTAIDRQCVTIDYGDGINAPATCVISDCSAVYGAWAPPAPHPDDFTADYSHGYTASGSYTAKFTFITAAGCDNVDPYKNMVTQAVTVTIP